MLWMSYRASLRNLFSMYFHTEHDSSSHHEWANIIPCNVGPPGNSSNIINNHNKIWFNCHIFVISIFLKEWASLIKQKPAAYSKTNSHYKPDNPLKVASSLSVLQIEISIRVKSFYNKASSNHFLTVYFRLVTLKQQVREKVEVQTSLGLMVMTDTTVNMEEKQIAP